MHMRILILSALLIALAGGAGAGSITIFGDRADTAVYNSGIFSYGPGSNGGMSGTDGGFDYSMVYVFQLPSLLPDQTISAADFSFDDQASGSSYYTDLYGLAWRVSPTVLASDWYSGPGDPDNALIEANFVPPSFSFSGRIGTSAAGNIQLASFLNAQYQAGALGGDFVFLRLSTDTAGAQDNNVNFYYTEDWAYTVAASLGNLSYFQAQLGPVLDVTVAESPVPEPATGLVLTGTLAVLWVARRRLTSPRDR